MKKDKLTIIIFILVGIIIGLLVALTVVLIMKKDDNSVKNNEDSNYVENKSDKDSNYVVIDTEEEILKNFNEINKEKDESKIKKGFTDIVDFIFYGKEIKGKTFSELKDNTKVKLLDVALSIDKKIDDYFPNYKENLKEKYQNIKIKVVETYINTVNKICDNNPNFCDNFKSDFNNMKEKFGITFDYIKKYGSIGLDKIKDWYQDLKD